SKTVFGKSITKIRFLSTGQTLDVRTEEITEETQEVSLQNIQFRAMAARIKNEIGSQSILSPYESNVVPLPHQILALEKVMNGAYCRFLIADEVGMGKTIEAGLCLKELKLRGIVKRTLIVVPLSAMTQWQSELKKHFNEKFHIYDSEFIGSMTKTFGRLESDNDINIWQQNNQIIVSMDSLRPLETRKGWSQDKIDEYNKYRIESVINADFDLLIIDECHKVGGSDVNVGRFQMAQTLCSAIPNVLLLSATPHRGKSDHFRRIMKLLDDNAFSGTAAPTLDELEPYVVRTEKRQAIDYSGKPLFNKRRTERLVAQYDNSRHRLQQKLYDSVTEYVKKGFDLATKTKNTSYAFVMILFQRMMSSSTQAILDAIEKRANRLETEKNQTLTHENIAQKLLEEDADASLSLDFEEKINEQIQNTAAAYETELAELKCLLAEAKHCKENEVDVKFEYLLNRLDELKKVENNMDLKFIIFTEFTSTQTMLCEELANRGGYTSVAINGSMDADERGNALKKFKERVQILVSTDAAGESLNMQFAHIVINYDVPWNPMMIEQRIGRVDRIGQSHEVLAINMMIDNSIDSRVYEVIETKLNRIFSEMGIDKTNDVLDSTLEINSVNKLYRTSLLDPSRFESESTEWLEDIKEKLAEYKVTEKQLPITKDKSINLSETEKIKHSPIPVWLCKMCESYFSDKKIKYETTLDGLAVNLYKDEPAKYYTFDTKVSLDNPVPELLTIQSELIQKILSEAVPVNKDAAIPVIQVSPEGNASGIFMLWSITAHNAYETQNKIIPIFISDHNQYFASYSQTLWAKLSMCELSANLRDQDCNSESIFDTMQPIAEEHLQSIYISMENDINSHSATMRINREKAFNFQIQQAERIGIEQIKNYRVRKYKSEYDNWIVNYETDKQVIPELKCLMMLKVTV
ncbi:MAG: DEAD/DEAH box helicase family protein, partial [Spirochaetales bacterium]|nr:DEAD/DEAH box helicase family protein [Spirochaetales bacterium]